MTVEILTGDCRRRLAELPDGSVHCVVTSPPYFGLRDYEVDAQIGREETPAEFIAELVAVFAEVRRVLRDDGTFWLNIGDSYANDSKWGGSTGGKHRKALHGTDVGRKRRRTGLRPKELIGIPWMLAFALRADGWTIRQDVIWNKPNPQPEPVKDRCTSSHEHLFMLVKSPTYYFDAEAIAEPSANAGKLVKLGKKSFARRQQEGAGVPLSGNGKADVYEVKDTRNKRDVWTVPTEPYPDAHFATYPPALIEPCILAGCPAGGVVLDPFGGAGTTALVADRLGRNAILLEVNPKSAALAQRRIEKEAGLFAEVSVA